MSAQTDPTQPATSSKATAAEPSVPGRAAESTVVIGGGGGEEGREAPAVGPEEDVRPSDVDGASGLTKSQLKRQRKKQKQATKGSAPAAAENADGKDAGGHSGSSPALPIAKMERVPVQQPPSSQFELELDWCREQLQLGLHTRKASPKQAEEAARALRVLSSSKAPTVKKRQVMQAVFGDYRKKMASDRARHIRSMETAMKTMKLVPVPAKPKSVFYKACVSKECRNRLHSAGENASAGNVPASTGATVEASATHAEVLSDAWLASIGAPSASTAAAVATTARPNGFRCAAQEFKFNFFDASES
ncbi:UPF0488 protein C8orf33 homolog isoform X2 [Lethenteron reissneri]|nr:UPF0488 protein C8orf33 homolog isoform X2 [Lethenteron reissneri]